MASTTPVRSAATGHLLHLTPPLEYLLPYPLSALKHGHGRGELDSDHLISHLPRPKLVSPISLLLTVRVYDNNYPCSIHSIFRFALFTKLDRSTSEVDHVAGTLCTGNFARVGNCVLLGHMLFIVRGLAQADQLVQVVATVRTFSTGRKACVVHPAGAMEGIWIKGGIVDDGFLTSPALSIPQRHNLQP